jgi:hypothetical protein
MAKNTKETVVQTTAEESAKNDLYLLVLWVIGMLKPDKDGKKPAWVNLFRKSEDLKDGSKFFWDGIIDQFGGIVSARDYLSGKGLFVRVGNSGETKYFAVSNKVEGIPSYIKGGVSLNLIDGLARMKAENKAKAEQQQVEQNERKAE